MAVLTQLCIECALSSAEPTGWSLWSFAWRSRQLVHNGVISSMAFGLSFLILELVNFAACGCPEKLWWHLYGVSFERAECACSRYLFSHPFKFLGLDGLAWMISGSVLPVWKYRTGDTYDFLLEQT